mgnify:CR=1 FL=1
MKKNLMFIVPKLVGGGAEKTVANLSKALASQFNIYIVIFNDTKEKYNYGGKLIVLPNNKSNKFVSKIKNKINQIKKIKELKRKLNINYSVSFLRDADIINVFSKTNEKVFVSIRNKESVDSLILKNKFKIYITCTLCDKVIAISREVKDDLVKNFHINKNKIVTIYNPCIISEEYHKTNYEFSGNNNIINVGRLSNQKGQWHLIRAFKEVVNKIPNAKLIILGEGNLKEYLEGLVKQLELENNIKLLGFINNPYDYIKQSNLFVFSSLYEGLGNAVMEALSCGIPVLSTDYDSGAREILAPNTDYREKNYNKIEYAQYGVLIPVCDGKKYTAYDQITKEEKIMANAIIELLNDKEKQNLYKMKSLERSKDFKIEKISQQWIDILR